MSPARSARSVPEARTTLRALLLGGSAICGAAAAAFAAQAVAATLPTQLTVDLSKATASGALNGKILNAGAATPTTLTYTSTGGSATVALSAPRTLIDWTTFTVGSGATLNYTFSGVSDVVLNRVMSGAITVEAGGAVNGTFAGKPGGNVWFLAPGGVFIHGTVTASGVLATNNTSLADIDLLSGDLGALKGELASATTSLIDLSGVATATGAQIDGSGNIVLSGAVSANGDVMLESSGTLSINAPVSALGAVPVTLAYNTASPANLAFGAGGSVTFAKADGSPATSDAGGALTINGQNYTLLYKLAETGSTGPDSGAADVAGIDANTAAGGDAGFYALATDLAGTGTAAKAQFGGAVAGAGTNVFSGVLEGLGHSITNLTINDTTPSENLGLLGSSTGVVRDIALVGGSVTGAALNYVGGSPLDLPLTGAVGSLVGYNGGGGVVVGATSSAAVNTVPDADTYGAVGGLVGFNDKAGVVLNASAVGAVYGGNEVGGLVGRNRGAITNAFATGAVYGGDQSSVGGLVGNNGGAISQAYATGAVTDSGASIIGGLVGFNISNSNYVGSVSAVAFDTSTSGQTVGIGLDNNASDGAVAALTTAQLQGALPSGFNSAIWSTGAGLYPYLTAASPNGVQAVSGFAASDAGLTVLASGVNGAETVGLVGGGARLGSATTGANGYYYIATAAGSLTAGESLLVSTLGGGGAATLTASTGAVAQTGANLFGGAVTVTTAATTLSAAPTLSAAKAAATAAAGTDADSLAAIAGATGQGLVATGAFTVDQTLSLDHTLAIETASGSPLSVAAGITVTAGGSLGLRSGGALAINAPITVNGAEGVALAYDDASTTNLSFGAGGALTFANADGSAANASAGGVLRINNVGYTLLYKLTDSAAPTGNGADTGADDIAGIDAAGAGAAYALATDVSGTGSAGATQFSGALAGTQASGFTGVFEGLGHSVTNLTIQDTTGRNTGLFGLVGSGGVVRDVALVGGSVSLTLSSPTIGSASVGDLVGQNRGVVAFATASGAVTGTGTASAPAGATLHVGGLIGYNSGGQIVDGSATGTVTGVAVAGQGLRVGGLAGEAVDGSITGSFATGAVSATGDTSAFVDDPTNGYVRAGGLVGTNLGPISASYATGSVTGVGGDVRVGGLAGTNSPSGDTAAPTPTIDGSYATGAVSATSGVNGVASAGGLVAYNNGPITNSAASGAVSASGGTGASVAAGGLVGYNGPASGSTVVASLSGVLATGAVSASPGTLTSVGGVVGVNDVGGTVASAVYDSLTTGQATGIGLDSNAQGGGVTGLTTTQLQTGGLPTGFDASVWGGGSAGLYPYLTAFYPNGAAAISGFAYTDAGSTVLASGLAGAAPVALTIDGVAHGVATTGANGYYYFVVPAGSIDAVKGSTVLTTVAANAAPGAVNAAGLAVTTGTAAGVDLYGGDLLFSTPAVTYSASGFAPALAQVQAYGTTPAFVAALPLFIRASGASFTVDSQTTFDRDLEIQTTAAAAPITVAAALSVSSGHTLTLASAGDLTLGADVGAGTLSIASGGAVQQTAGVITAGAVTGSSVGGLTLTDANKIGSLADVTNSGGGDIVVSDAVDLGVGAVSNTGGSISLTTTGALIQTAGALTSGQDLTLSAGGALILKTAPVVVRDYSVTGQTFSTTVLSPTFSPGRDFTIHALGALTLAQTLTAPGNLSVTADGALDASAFALTATTGNLALKSGDGLLVGSTTATSGDTRFTTTAGDITLSGANNTGAGVLTLTSAGAISGSAAVITAGEVTGGSHGGATLTGVNLVDTLGPFANTGSGSLSFTGARTTGLTVSGTVDAGAGNVLSLTTTNGGALTLAADVVASNGLVALTSASTISQSGGKITAANLTSSSQGAASLTKANQVGALAAFTNGGSGDLSFTDALPTGLTLGQSIDAGAGNIVIATVGSPLTLAANLSTDSAHGVTLSAGGMLTQTGGVITTGTVAGSSVGGAALSANNSFDALAGFTNNGAGTVSITDAKATGLTVTSAVDAGSGNDLILRTTAAAPLTLSADLTASGGSVNLVSAGSLSQTAGVITTATLRGSSVGGADLTRDNLFDSLAGFVNTGAGAVSIVDAKASGLTVTSLVDAGAGDSLTLKTKNGAALSLLADLSANGGTVDLVSDGVLSQSAGAVMASALTGSSSGGASLTGGNLFDTLAGFTNRGVGGVSITDAKASGLTVTAAVDAGAANSLTLTTTTGGAMTLAADLSAAGGTVTLNAAGVLDQASGVITTSVLSGASVGGASLADANLFDSIAGFANVGGGNVTIADAKSSGLTVAFGGGGVTNAGGGAITLDASGPLLLQADVSAAGGVVNLTSGGTINQTAGVITAATLNSASNGDTILAKANQVDTLASFTNGGAGQLAFVDAKASGLTVGQDVSAGAGNVSITSTAAGVALDLAVNLSTDASHRVQLSSGGAIVQTAGVITTGDLTTASTGGATLTGNNSFDTLSGLSNLGAGDVSVVDVKAGGLTVTGLANAGNGNSLTLTTTTGPLTLSAGLGASGGSVNLFSAGTITQTAGVITTASLASASHGAASLTGANNVVTLTSFTNGGAGDLSFTDAAPGGFTVGADINAGAGNLNLTSTAAGRALSIGVNLATDAAHGVTLTSAGQLIQTGGQIVTGSLGGGAAGGANVTGVNQFDTLAAFANTGGDVSISDAKTSGLTVTGAIDAGTGDALNLRSGGLLTLANDLNAAGGAVRLSSAGAILQTAGVITTGGLTTFSTGGLQLTDANQFATLAGVSNTGGGAAITDALVAGLTVAGDVTPGGALALTTTGGPLVLAANLVAPGQLVSLRSAGAISQTGVGVISANRLDSVSAGSQSLTNANLVDILGTFANGGAGTLTFTDAQPTGLTLASDINAGAGFIAINSTAPGVLLQVGVNLTTTSQYGVKLTSAGAIDQTAGVITGGGVTGSSVGGASLTDANAIDVIQGFTNVGTGGVSITGAKASGLTVTAAIDAGPGNSLTLTTTNGGALTLGADLTALGGTVSLLSSGALSQTAGVISTATLTGDSVGGASLTDANRFDTLAVFANSGVGDVAITDAKASGLTVTGAVDAGVGNSLALTTTNGAALTLSADVRAIGGAVNLTSAGVLSQTSGVITTAALSGSSVGGASLNDANLFDTLAGFANSGVGTVSITDAKASGLTVTGAVTSGGNGLTLTTTNGGDMTLSANLIAAGSSVTLVSGGALNQTAGVITTSALSGYSVGGASLTDANRFDTLTGFTNSGAGTVSITDAKLSGLAVTGAVDSGGGDLTLTTTTVGPLTLAADLTASGAKVSLVSAGTLHQTAGVITAATVTGSSAGGASLTDANAFDTLAGFVNSGDQGLSITDAKASGLTVTGAVNAGTGNGLTLTTANGGALRLGADLSAPGGTVDLVSATTISQTTGAIITSALTGASVGAVTLTGVNQFDTLAGFVNAGVGAVSITDAKASGLTVTAAVDAGPGNALTLTTTNGGGLTLAADLSAAGGTVALDASGAITQMSGVVSTSAVTGYSTGGATLQRANAFDSLAGFVNSGGGAVSIVDAKASGLTVTGAVDSGGAPLTLTTINGGPLTLSADLTATGSTVDLVADGAVTQTAGVITTAVLTGSSVNGASLTDANQFDILAGFVNNGAGAVSITDARTSGLTVTRVVDSGGDPLTLTASGGGLTLSADLTASASSVNLVSAGALDQTAGVITTSILTGSSVGGASLTDPNRFDTLAGFVNSGGAVSIVDAAPTGLTVTGAVDAGADDALTLTTTNGGPLTLAADLRAQGGSVTLTASGTIDQTAGVIDTATLAGTSVGGASLTDPNAVATLANFTNSDSGALSFVNAGPLVVGGAVDNTAGLSGGAGRDVAITVLSGDLSGTGVFTAARDVAVAAPQGALTFTTATAGDDLVLRAGAGVTVSGALTAAGTASPNDDADASGAGDVLAGFAPFVLYGQAYVSQVGGGHIDVVTTAGDINLATGLSAAGDVRLQALSGAVHTADIKAQNSILISAGQGVDRGQAASNTLNAGADVAVRSDQGDLALGLVTAGRDIVLEAATGSVGLVSASAGDDLLVRAGAAATVTGTLTSGLAGDSAGVADQFLLDQPGQAANLFGHIYSAATGGSSLEVVARTGAVTLGDAASAYGGGLRLQSGGAGVSFTTLTATGDIAVDAATAVVGQTGAAGLDVAVRGGAISLGSLRAGDDIVLRAGGALSVTGGLTAGGATNAAGAGDDLAAYAPLSPFGGGQKTLGGGSSIDVGAATVTIGGDTAAGAAGSDVRIVASSGDLSLGGAVTAGQDVAFDATNGAVLVGGAIQAGRDLAVWARAGTVSLAQVVAGDDLVVRGRAGVIVSGSLTAGSGADGAGAADDLLAASPTQIMTAFGHPYASLSGGGAIDIASAAGAVTLDATAAAPTGDIRLQAATSVAYASLSAGGNLLIDAGYGVDGGSALAGGDIAFSAGAAGTGSLNTGDLTAGGVVVLRAAGSLLVDGKISAGLTPSGNGPGFDLVTYAPLTLFGGAEGALTGGGSIDIRGATVTVGGAMTAAGNRSDIRVVATGPTEDGGPALNLAGTVSAGGDVALETLNGDLTVGGALSAGGDVAARAQAGSVTLVSAAAGDDIVLRAANSVTSGALSGGNNAGQAGFGDSLAAASPMTLFGQPHASLTTGANINVVAASGPITITGPISAGAGDVLLQSGAGAIQTGAISAGQEIGLDGSTGVRTGVLTAGGGDVAVLADTGSLSVTSAFASDQIVLRAPNGAVTADSLASGLGVDPAGLGEDLAAYDHLTIFAASDPALAGGSVNIGAASVIVSGAVTAGYDATGGVATRGADIRILATGPDGSGGPAIQLLGGAQATGDIALDSRGGGVLAAAPLSAVRDTAVWAEAGAVALTSAVAGDDLVLRARNGVTVGGGLSAGGGNAGAGAGDALIAAAPMTVFGHTYGAGDTGRIDVVTSHGAVAIGGAAQASGDVRLQALNGDVSLGDVNAGRDIVIDAAGSVTRNASSATDRLTAGQDVAVRAAAGSVAINSVAAGGATVLRAVNGGVTVTGDLKSGTAENSGAGAAGYLAAYSPSTLFGVYGADGGVSGGVTFSAVSQGDIDVRAGAVTVTGATTATGSTADVRVLATGLDTVTDGGATSALTLNGPVGASRDVAVDAVGGSAAAATTGSIFVGGPITAGRDIAARSLTGGLNLVSGSAGDNVVLVATQGAVGLHGSLTATGANKGGIGATLFNTVAKPLDGLFTLGDQSIFIDGKTYANAGYASPTPAALTATTGVGVVLADSAGLDLADADPKAGSWLKASTILTKTLTLFESKGNIVVGAATLNTPVTTANLYVDSTTPSDTSGKVKVVGLFAPSVDNVVSLNIGTPDPTATASSWTPTAIDVINDAGAGPNTGAIGFTSVSAGNVYSTSPRTFYAASLYAKTGILLGTQLFVDTNAGVTSLPLLMQIDPSRPTPTTPANTSKAVMLAAGDLSLSAGSLIVQQNTTGLHTTDGTGYYVTRTLTLTAYGPNPPAIDLFGVFTKPGTTIPITGPAAADVNQVFLPVGPGGTSLATSPYRALYRINSCVIGELGNCTPTTDAIVTIPLDQLSRGALLSRDELDVEDPTITGAPNEEIWRRPDDRQ